MKNAINYKKFKKYLFKHGVEVVKNFSQSNSNMNVYAFVFDTQSEYGTVIIKWNTYEGLNETLKKESYQAKTKEQIYSYNGLKYSIGDFYFEDLCTDLEDFEIKYCDYMEEADEDACEHNRNLFMNTLVEVMLDLSPYFDSLNKAEEFIFYVVDHDEDDFKYIRKTVDAKSFYKAFPELIEQKVY